MIITKSVSRFARNTVDCIKYVGELKAMGIPVIFEKEGLNTMHATSEIYLSMVEELNRVKSIIADKKSKQTDDEKSSERINEILAAIYSLKDSPRHSMPVDSVAFAPDGKTFLSGSSDNTVRVWDSATGQCLRVCEGHSDDVNASPCRKPTVFRSQLKHFILKMD